jgi:RNA-directed DNA polymerase
MELELTGKSGPIRRVWIAKPGTDEKRPLGIPNLRDRALQALVKLAIEPECEAYFEPNSYGFRPGRSVRDAIKQIKNNTLHSKKVVYDADLEKCFDRIDHKALLDRLSQPPNTPIYNQVKAWLEAGVVEGYGSPYSPPTLRGTPQGGVISPLLANIALHGLEYGIKDAILKECSNPKKTSDQTKVVRYADDFIIMAPDRQSLNVAIAATEKIVAKAGLNIKASKTRITDTESGFSFLGFEIRQITVGKHRASKASGGRLTNYVVRIIPTKKNIDKHFSLVRRIVKTSTTPGQLISKLNPIIKGFVNYVKYSDATTWGLTAEWSRRLYLIISNWVKRTYHTRKRINKVWKNKDGKRWVFYGTVKVGKKGKEKVVYLNDYYGPFINYGINSYVKVTGDKSPYDGNWTYWGTRNSTNQNISELQLKLLRKQKGKCPWCSQSFNGSSILETDHIIPKNKGGTNERSNLQILHVECHLEKTISER